MENLHLIKETYDSLFSKIVSLYEEGNVQGNTMAEILSNRDIVKEYQKTIARHSLQTSQDDDQESTPATRHLEELEYRIDSYSLLAKGIREPFKLFIMGQGNYGKSTLINSILGTGNKHATEGILPVTWKIDVFEDRDTDNLDMVEIVFKDGSSQIYSQEDAQELIESEDRNIKDQRKDIKAKLLKFKREKSPSEVELLVYEKKLKRDQMEYSNIIESHWGVANSSILKKFSIVDTPGLNQFNSSGELMNSAQEYFHKADGVIWLLDSQAVSSSGPAVLINDLNESLKMFGNQNKAADSMIAVLNRIDLVGGEENRQEVIQSAEKIYGDIFNKIIPYSAKQAYQAVVDNDRELEVESGRVDLLKEIDQVFFKNSKQIQCEKKLDDCQAYNQLVIQSIQNYHQQMLEDREIAMNRARLVKGVFENKRAVLNQEIYRWLAQPKAVFQDELVENLEKLSGRKDVSREMLAEVFKLSLFDEAFKKASKRSVKVLTEEATEFLRNNIITQYESLRKYEEIDFYVEVHAHFNLGQYEVAMPNVTSRAAAAAVGGGLAFGPVGALIGGGVAALLSFGSRNDTINTFRNEMNKIIENLVKQYEETIELAINTAEKQVQKQILDSFLSLYGINREVNRMRDIINATNLIINDGKRTIKLLSENREKRPELTVAETIIYS